MASLFLKMLVRYTAVATAVMCNLIKSRELVWLSTLALFFQILVTLREICEHGSVSISLSGPVLL